MLWGRKKGQDTNEGKGGQEGIAQRGETLGELPQKRGEISAVAAYLEDLRAAKNASPATIASYRNDLVDLEAFLESLGLSLKRPREIGRGDLQA